MFPCVACSRHPRHAPRAVCVTIILAAAFAILAQQATATATIITFGFTGEVTFAMDSGNLLGGTVSVGSPFQGSFTFDSDAPDNKPSNSNVGAYVDLISAIEGEIGPVSFSKAATDVDEIGVLLLSTTHAYTVGSNILLNDHLVRLSIQLSDDSKSLFDNDLLPSQPPALQDVTFAEFGLVAEDMGLNVSGKITSLFLVPEPVLAPVMGLMSILLLRRRPQVL